MTEREPATASGVEPKQTEVGSVFVSNYPPYSFWTPDGVQRALEALDRPPVDTTPFGLYLHIPFCRKRCKFCYFRVYIDKTGDEVQTYMDALGRELELYASKPALAERQLKFIYFGGGTPSFISSRHLRSLVEKIKSLMPWDAAEEVAFECEPGTLTRPKLETIRELGITRLSLGVENFDDRILEENGRAHVSKEIDRVAPWIKQLDFEQVNVDLIAGMVGENWDTWKETVRRTIELDADSVTIYQMELPFNTVYSKQLTDGTEVRVADWSTKRAWHDYAFEQLEQAGYVASTAYTMIKPGHSRPFVYRDSVWEGSDLVAAGVSSFGHIGGVHYQNEPNWGPYLNQVAADRLPIGRAFAPSPDEMLTRETILQLKRGHLDSEYFVDKFAVDIRERFGEIFGQLEGRGMLWVRDDEIRLTRDGLLRVDSLLPEFYAAKYQNARYT